jgi:acyl CoA:acetate/3-ketoacid CoA transferase beta subunit
VLSGIGNAHLAAWTAVTALQEGGTPVGLAAELGILGLHPAPGDPYLFARGNFPTADSLTDVFAVLAREVSGPATRSLGVLGAGQVDADGNINSTWSANGDFILGSGGANDVATGADETIVVVAHSADRLVRAVPYVTAPGAHVSTIVTSAAVLERRHGQFEVTRFIGGGDAQEAAERIRAGIGWDIALAPDFGPEPEPDHESLQRLRGFDPAGVFAGRR